MDRGQSRRLNKSFAYFEDWRDEVLEQEELDSHKLSRKIVREEHWITHGVSGRRKRNMRRVKELAGVKSSMISQPSSHAAHVLASSGQMALARQRLSR